MSKGLSERKKAALEAFDELFDGTDEKPTPEGLIVQVMHGSGSNMITDRQIEAAKMLLPYRLPKLLPVAADPGKGAGLSHEDWIDAVDSASGYYVDENEDEAD